MRFERRFLVAAPLEEVVEFHRHPAALEAISPPFPPVKVLDSSDPLDAGGTMTMRIWFGPIPMRWRAELEAIDGHGFADRQVRGPFAAWRHEHRFVAQEETTAPKGTWVIDRIEARLSKSPFRWAAGLMMWLSLPALFRYRAWKTRQLLGGRRSEPAG